MTADYRVLHDRLHDHDSSLSRNIERLAVKLGSRASSRCHCLLNGFDDVHAPSPGGGGSQGARGTICPDHPRSPCAPPTAAGRWGVTCRHVPSRAVTRRHARHVTGCTGLLCVAERGAVTGGERRTEQGLLSLRRRPQFPARRAGSRGGSLAPVPCTDSLL